MVVDAIRFVPQSRPRVFIIAIDARPPKPASLVADGPLPELHPKALVKASSGLNGWIWWRADACAARPRSDRHRRGQPHRPRWHGPEETARLLEMMTSINRAKVENARRAGKDVVGTIYRRTRRDADGARRQRAEARVDGVAGCLRTPRGGSSRQTIIVIQGRAVRSRLLSPREAARLMGLPDDYRLPARYNDAYHVAGDGVCVPAVRHIAEHLLQPLLLGVGATRIAAE